MSRTALLNIMVKAIMKAGRGIKRDYGELEYLQSTLKGPGPFVAMTEQRAAEVIIQTLQAARGDYSILSKQFGNIKGSDPFHRWIVNSLDGLDNLNHALPFFASSIALERDGELVAGVIYNPISEELFAAEKGKGAFLNDHRLRVSTRPRLSDAMLGTYKPFTNTQNEERHNSAHFLTQIETVFSHAAGVRICGCSALGLAYVAAGRFDGYWQHNISASSMAAGIILVREAGGFISDTKGGRQMFQSMTVVAGNDSICQEICKKVIAPIKN